MMDERMEQYLRTLEPELPSWLLEIEKKAVAEDVPVIKKPMQRLLRFLISKNQPEKILEVGCAVGFSSLFMSLFLREGGEIDTIENAPDRILKAKENFKRQGEELSLRKVSIRLLEGDAADYLKQLKKEGRRYDFIFMDAAKGQYLAFLPDVLELLHSGGILLSDNILQDGAVLESRYAVIRRNRTIHTRMREYLYTLMQEETCDTLILPEGDGAAVTCKK